MISEYQNARTEMSKQWIVQEAVLSQRQYIFCGNFTIKLYSVAAKASGLTAALCCPLTISYFLQITNNVVDGLYGTDLRFEATIKLAALHIQQVATEDAGGKTVKISVKNIDKDYGGMQRFVPADVLNHSKEKRLRKAVSQQIKQNLTLAAPGQKHMNALQCKWHYLNIACDIFSYGGKYFSVVLVNGEEKQDDLEKVLTTTLFSSFKRFGKRN